MVHVSVCERVLAKQDHFLSQQSLTIQAYHPESSTESSRTNISQTPVYRKSLSHEATGPTSLAQYPAGCRASAPLSPSYTSLPPMSGIGRGSRPGSSAAPGIGRGSRPESSETSGIGRGSRPASSETPGSPRTSRDLTSKVRMTGLPFGMDPDELKTLLYEKFREVEVYDVIISQNTAIILCQSALGMPCFLSDNSISS